MLRLFLWWWLPPLAYAALIWFVSALPQPAPGVDLGDLDKLIHAVEYAVLSLLVVRALWRSGKGALRLRSGQAALRTTAVAATALAGIYGVVDEIHQIHVPPREASVGDALADMAGAALAAALWYAARRRAHDPGLPGKGAADPSLGVH